VIVRQTNKQVKRAPISLHPTEHQAQKLRV